MADYSCPTVVRPNIPADAITMLELMVLTGVFTWERDGETVYFFSENGVPPEVQLDVAQVRALVAAAPDGDSSIVSMLANRLTELEFDEGSFDFPVDQLEYADILQDILRRCPDIDHITIASSWTCSRMLSDAFGGGVIVITRDQIQSANTNEMEQRMCDLARYGEVGCAPGAGEHRVLMLPEQIVRNMVADIEQLALDRGEATIAVTDDDIRAACLAEISTASLEGYLLDLTFSAAQAATRLARNRHG